MKINDKPLFKGRFIVEHFDESGRRKDLRIVENVIVTVGKNFLAAWLAAATQSDYFMQHIALGTGSSAASPSDTVLETELSTRVAGTITSNGAIWQNQAFFAPGVDTGTITEAGLFSASSGGTMLARQVFPAIIKGAGEAIQVTWQVTIL